MAENSAIEWCDHTFNPWEGCQPVGPGCENCYAEARDIRFTGGKHWGPGAPRRRADRLAARADARFSQEYASQGCTWTEAQLTRALAAKDLARAGWDRCKAEAIEAAMGIG